MKDKEILKKIQESFNKIVGDYDIISTIDHPYPSPVIRVYSSHNILLEEYQDKNNQKVLNLVWDTLIPEKDKKHLSKYINLSIIENKKEYKIYSNSKNYFLNKINKEVGFLDKIYNDFLLTAKKRTVTFKEVNDKIIINNLKEILNIYRKSIINSKNSYELYVNILSEFYILTDNKDLSNFILNNSKSLYLSNFYDWVAYIIELTLNTKYDLRKFYQKGYDKKFFRDYLTNETIYLDNNIEDIISGIKNRKIIFSSKVFFWAIFLAGKKHFGNVDVKTDLKAWDFIKKWFRSEYDLNIEELQLTEYKKDSYKQVEIDGEKNKKNDTFPYIFLHLGKKGFKNIRKNVLKIKEGYYYLCFKQGDDYNPFWDKAYKIRHSQSLNKTDEVQKIVSFIEKKIPISKDDYFLDFAGGSGRVSVNFINKVKQVYLFDWDVSAIEEAKKNDRIIAFRRDLRYSKLRKKYNVGVCLYSSIGYFSDCQNELMLNNFLNSIKSGGYIVLDLMNPDWVLKNSKNVFIEKEVHYEDEKYYIKHWRDVEFEENGIREVNRIVFDKEIDGLKEFSYFLKVYTKEWIVEKLLEFDYVNIEIFGSFDYEEMDDVRQRLIFVARKK